MVQQIEITLNPKRRGFHLVTSEIVMNLGTWQGIYFCEYRNYGGARDFVVTIIGE